VLPQPLGFTLDFNFVAPPLGMLVAAALYLRLKHVVACAKLHHQKQFRCIFYEYHARPKNHL